MKIVVARYNEDISWLTPYQDLCVIYNKGNEIELPNIPLLNMGREAHTYLHHIIENYENLDDITIFTQGNPFDHCPNFVEKIKDIVDKGIESPFVNLSSWVLQVHKLNCSYWPHHIWPNLVSDLVEFLFGHTIERDIWFGAGAIFAVKKEAILERPLEFYKKAIKTFPQTAYCNGYAYAFERLWPTIFGQ
jgi:hypothetical protein